jgi:hypothetical protein
MPGGGIGEQKGLLAGGHAFLGNSRALYFICRPVGPVKAGTGKLPGQDSVVRVGLKLASHILISSLGAFGKNFVMRVIGQENIRRRRQEQERQANGLRKAPRPHFCLPILFHNHLSGG